MVKTNICDDANEWRDDIRGIQPAAKTRLNHRHLNILKGEILKRHSRRNLKKRQPQTLDFGHIALHKTDNLLLRYHLSIDPYSLSEIFQVRRGEKTHTIARLLKHRCQHMRGRALAVGASDVDGVVVVVGVAQQTTKLLNTLQTRLIGCRTNLLERGDLIKKKIYGLRVGHTR